MQIIGLSGKRGVGKTLLADYFVRAHSFVKLSLAEDLRVMAGIFFDFSDKDLSDPSRKEKPFRSYSWSPRDFMINLGAFARFHDESYWLNRAIAKANSNTVSYVFDDVRFENEANAIRGIGGKIVRINRYEKLNVYGKDLDIDSEKALDNYKFDYTVEKQRNTTATELFKQGQIIVDELC